MSKMSTMSKAGKKNAKKSSFVNPWPICAVGKENCKKPLGRYQIFTDFCDNCGKECHEGCGELLDVPHKFIGDEPGFYCVRCLVKLPRSLYPRIPVDGVTQNIPKCCDDGSLCFETFMTERKKMVAKAAKKESKNKLPSTSFSYATRSVTTRVMRTRS